MSKIAVVGVHESIGREILSFLSEDGIKAVDVCAVDVNSPLGTQVSYGEDDELDVSNLEGVNLNDVPTITKPSEELAQELEKAKQENANAKDADEDAFEDIA